MRYYHGLVIPEMSDPPDMVSGLASLVDQGCIPRASGYQATFPYGPLPDWEYAPQGHVHVETRSGAGGAGSLGIMGSRGTERPLAADLRAVKFDSYNLNWTGASPIAAPTAWSGLGWSTYGITAFDFDAEIKVPVLIAAASATTSYKFDLAIELWAYLGDPGVWEVIATEVTSFEYLARAGTMHRFVVQASLHHESDDKITAYAEFKTRLTQAPGPYSISFRESDHFFVRRTL